LVAECLVSDLVLQRAERLSRPGRRAAVTQGFAGLCRRLLSLAVAVAAGFRGEEAGAYDGGRIQDQGLFGLVIGATKK
jgi:hypothetical protein